MTRDGVEVGTETFAIRTSGAGEARQTVAAARVHLHVDGESRHMVPRLLMVGSGLRFQGYQNTTSGDRDVDVRLEREGERLVAHVTSDRGERMRELRTPAGAILLEPYVAHQLHFVGSRVQAGETSFGVLPVGESQGGRATASVADGQTVRIAGTDVPATRVDLSVGNRTVRAWYDAQWRVLAVEWPTGHRAEREALP